MSIIYKYIDPILKEALVRKASGESKHQSFSNDEEAKPDTLLDHLLLEVTGKTPFFILHNTYTSFCLFLRLDFDVIRDEIVKYVHRIS